MLAFGEYRRTVQVWSHGYVVVRPTEREAEDYLRWYAEEQADHPWVDGWLSKLREVMSLSRLVKGRNKLRRLSGSRISGREFGSAAMTAKTRGAISPPDVGRYWRRIALNIAKLPELLKRPVPLRHALHYQMGVEITAQAYNLRGR